MRLPLRHATSASDAHIKGISLKKAATYICRFQSVERAMSKIRRSHTVPNEYAPAPAPPCRPRKQRRDHDGPALTPPCPTPLPCSFDEQFQRADIMFQHQMVFDTRSKQRKPLNPFAPETEDLAKVRNFLVVGVSTVITPRGLVS